MIKITKEEFENSFYYMGSGLDIQPLIRFTHITNTFIYTNLFMSKSKVENWYDEQFKFHPDIEVMSKEIDTDFDEVKSYDLHPAYQSHLSSPFFMNENEKKSYIRAFQRAIKQPQWAITYILKRKSLHRTIELKIVATEAIASYIALSHNGKYAPKIVATIQTGVLEETDGFLNRFFESKSVKLPQQWIRGVVPLDPNDRILAGENIDKWKSNALAAEGVFNTVGQNFNHKWITTDDWYSGKFEGTGMWINERHCKAFIPQEEADKIKTFIFNRKDVTEKHKISNSLMQPCTINDGDVVVLPKLLANTFNYNGTIIIWEDVLKYTISDIQNRAEGKAFSWWRNNPIFVDVKSQLAALQKELITKEIGNNTTIHIIPFCYEDSAELYYNTIKQWNYNTITYANGILDFIDLKVPLEIAA